MGRLTKEEMETIIRFDETNAPSEIFTFNSTLKRKLHSLCEKHPDQFLYDKERSEKNGSGGEFFRVPKRYIKVASPRVLSDDQKQKKREQARRNLKTHIEQESVS